MQVIPMADTPKPEETPQALAERMAPPCDSDLYRYYDADTGLNHALLARLDTAQRIYIAGQASSHCVRATTEHLLAHLPGGRPGRLVLLTDAMSPVAGFEAQQAAFFAAMRAAGARLATVAELMVPGS